MQMQTRRRSGDWRQKTSSVSAPAPASGSLTADTEERIATYVPRMFAQYGKREWQKLHAVYAAARSAATKENEKLRRSLLYVTLTPERMLFDNAASSDMDGRVTKMRRYLEAWHRRFGRRLGLTSSLVLYVSDAYLWEHPELPACVFAKPINRPRGGLLIPDDHFFCNETLIDAGAGQPPRYVCLSQDELVAFFRKECAQEFRDRADKAYFRGADTGRQGKWAVRRELADRFANSGGTVIDVRLGPPRVSQKCYCRPKVLLNLPGNQPWSYRMRELFLTGSLVVDVVVHVSYDGGKTYNDRWVQWWSWALTPGADYIQVDIRWIAGNDSHNAVQHALLADRMQRLMKEVTEDPERYAAIAASGKARMQSITNRTVDKYVGGMFAHARGLLPPLA